MAKPTPLEPPVTMAQRCRSELRSTSPKREGAFHRTMKLRSSISLRQTVISAGSPTGSAAPVQTQVPSTPSRVELPNPNFEF